MSTPHQGARRALEEFRDDVAAVYPELVSLIAYGSAVTDHFREDHSDVNLLLVLPKVDAETLARGAATLRRHWKKHRILPLVLSESELRASTDVFAVELLDIQERHVCLKGTDPFETMQVTGAWLRHQCEFELRGKLFRLRQGYFECDGKDKPLQILVVHTLGSVLPLGRALLRLAGETPPVQRADLVEALARRHRFDAGPWLEALELKEGRRVRALRPASALYADFLASMDALVRNINDAT
ncbi:MAG: nucleotidyltransferase domain-containing protein [Candidatus Eisenbacteria bacterium]|nr:nucleotidyltransferase domain-containing protein [Candidatus Eisenbacteria bacterium]